MTITPSTVTLNHKLHTKSPSFASVSFSEPTKILYEYSRALFVENKPTWVKITRNSQGNSASINKVISTANNLNTGVHSVNITLKMRVTTRDDAFDENGDYTFSTVIHTLGVFILRINVTDTQLLTLTPKKAVFEYKLGGTQPSQQLINVLSESNWTVTKNKNWVNLPTSSGSSNGSFYIGVIPSGLAVGTHTDTITVVDRLRTKTIAVSLVISEADTDTTFLYVSPQSYNLNYTVGGFLVVKNIEYNASGNWKATASESWLRLSATSGAGGVGTVQLTLQNTSSLTEGVYTAEVSFELGGLVKKVYLTLNVFDFIVNVLDPNILYFTKENNIIELSSRQIETHLTLSMATNYEGNNYVNKKTLPFYNGAASRRIGAFPQIIIGERPMLPNIYAINLIFPYDPVELNLLLTEEDLFSDIVYQAVPVNGVQFLKGKKPPSNWVTDMPLTRYLTKKGVLVFSVLSNGGIGNKILITGTVNNSYNFPNPEKPIYTAILPMRELGNLNVGDSFEVDVLNNKLTVNIIPEGNDHCLVFWENENGVWDVAEFTGDIIEKYNQKSTHFDFIKDHNTKETKVVNVEKTILYKINTGWIYNPDDVLGLSKLLQATNVYIQFSDKIVKVNPKRKTLEISKTEKTKISFDLNFENVLK